MPIFNNSKASSFSRFQSQPQQQSVQQPRFFMMPQHFQEQQNQVDQQSLQNQSKRGRKKTEDWTMEEQALMFGIFFNHGPKWSYISSLINKNPNAVKNRFYGKIRKLLRRLSAVGKYETKTKKHINYNALIRPIQAATYPNQPFQNFFEKRFELRIKIVEYSRNSPQNLNAQLAEGLIDQVHKFNMLTRSYRFRTNIKKQKEDHQQVKIQQEPYIKLQQQDNCRRMEQRQQDQIIDQN